MKFFLLYFSLHSFVFFLLHVFQNWVLLLMVYFLFYYRRYPYNIIFQNKPQNTSDVHSILYVYVRVIFSCVFILRYCEIDLNKKKKEKEQEDFDLMVIFWVSCSIIDYSLFLQTEKKNGKPRHIFLKSRYEDVDHHAI
jgi:hypothetical protein